MDSIGGKKKTDRATRGFFIEKTGKILPGTQTGPQNYHRNLSFKGKKG